MPRITPTPDGQHVMSTRLPHELLTALHARAAANDRTLGGEVRRALRQHVGQPQNDDGLADNQAEVEKERVGAHDTE